MVKFGSHQLQDELNIKYPYSFMASFGRVPRKWLRKPMKARYRKELERIENRQKRRSKKIADNIFAENIFLRKLKNDTQRTS